MRIKEVLERRDKLKSYLDSLSIANSYCEKQIGNTAMTQNLKEIYAELETEFKQINKSLKPFEDMDM